MAWVLLAVSLAGAAGWLAAVVYRGRDRERARVIEAKDHQIDDAKRNEAAALAQAQETARAATAEAAKQRDVEAELRRQLAAAQEELAKSRQPGQARAGLNGLFGGQP